LEEFVNLNASKSEVENLHKFNSWLIPLKIFINNQYLYDYSDIPFTATIVKKINLIKND